MLFTTLLSLKPRYLGIAALGVIGVLATIPIVLSNDMPWVAVSFERGTYSVAEGNSVTVTVNLSVAPERQVVVPITKANEDGASNSDYSGVPAYVTFESGKTEKSFTFSVSQDMVDDDGESVQLGFGSNLPTGVTEGTTDEATVFLIDDDGIGVTVPPATLTIGEGSSKTYTMALTSQPTAAVTIAVTAPSGSDVSVDKTTLTFTSSNWDDEQTVTVSAAQDDDALDETATITHSVTSTDSDYDGIRAGSIDVTVIDDEDIPVTVTFGQAGHTIAEGSAVTVRVTLSEDPERQVVIPITKSEQGGITSADYSGVPDSVTFESGDTEKSFIVTAAQDGVDDDDESVTVGLGTLPNAVTAGAIDETTVSINDDDVPSVTIRFEQSSYALDEGGDVTVKVILSHDPERQVVIPITKSEQGGATSDDYSGVPSSVTFESGETEKSFTFTATQDMVDDDGTGDGESVRVAFGTLPADVGAGATNETTVAIIDDDGAGVAVSPTRLSIGEGRSRTYTLVLASEPTANVTVTVTAPSGSDVFVDKRSLTFNTSNWADKQTVSASAEQDFDGSDDTATITHSVTAAGSDYSGKPVASVSVTVIDDDDVRVKANFEQANYRVTEGSTVTIKVTLSEDPERQVIVPITTIEQGGATDDDYSGVPDSVTFESGDTEKSFTFTATQDKADDDGESVKLDFGTLPNAVTSTTDETTVTITDDDPTIIARDEETPVVAKAPDVPVKVSFERTGYTVVEGYTVTVTVVLSKDPERQVVIPITKTEEGGITSADYSGVPPSVIFNSGDTSSSFTFTATQDQLQDDDESLRLDLGSLPDAVTAGTLKVTTVSIVDDGPVRVAPVRVVPVTVSFETNSYSVDEGSWVAVKVVLSTPPGRQVVIPITKTEYGGITPSDYSGVPSQVIFETGEREKTFDFLAVQDLVDDDEEAVQLGFGSSLPDSVTRGATDQTMVNIKDNDGVGVRVSPTRLTIDEGEDDTYTVVLNSQPTAEVTVTVGTPTDPDVSVDETTLTFTTSTWDDAQTVTVSTDQDEDYLDDTATISHSVTSTDADYNGIRVRSLSVKVVDDEDVPVTVNFASATYSVNEGGRVTIRVTLDKDPERQVVLPITKTEQGDASSADYSGVPETVTFASGQTAKTFTFFGTQDNIDDDGESVLLGFDTSLLDRVSDGTTDEATVSINDDDGVGVTVAPTTLTISEGRSKEYTVVLNSQPTANVTITISTSGSSDVSAEETTLTFTDSNWDDRQTVTVTAAQDDDDHLDESATVTHAATSTDSDYNGISVSSVDVDVTDDEDVPVTVTFEQATYLVDEGDQVTVEVTLSEDPERRVVIPINRVEQDGATSSDYSGVPRNVIFASGQTERSFTFTARQDTVDDDGESVKLGFGTLPNAVTEGTNNEATIDINDDDNPFVKVNFGKAAYSVAEGSTVTVTVTLSADPERQVEIPITATDRGGVSSTDDYSGVPEDVTFVSGDTEETFTFTAAQDMLNDDGESVRLSFGSDMPSRISGGTISRTTISINDDDDDGVTITPNALTIDEGFTDTYTVVLTSEPTHDVTITITVPSGSDISANSPANTQTLTFTDSTWQTEQTVTVSAGQDDDHLDDTGTITHSVTSTDTDYNNFGAGSVEVTTTDDEDVPVTVSFEQASYEVAEGGTVTVKVTLSEDPERYVTIPIVKTEQDGATSDDYLSLPLIVTFTGGETEQVFSFAAVQDTVDDDGESVKLALDTSQLDRVSDGTTVETTVSITDDDVPPVDVFFEFDTYSVDEGDNVTIKVKLSADPARQVIIPITKAKQDGASDADFTVPADVTFESGDTEKTFTLTATQDTVDDDGESVKLAFNTSSLDRVSDGTPAEATVSIGDDDDPPVTVSFEFDTYSVDEGSTVDYKVILSADPERQVVIPITKTDLGGVSNTDDYSGVPENVTFESGDTEQTFTFTATQDTVDDDGESVTLGFDTSLLDRVSEGTTNETTVSIDDDDVPSVEVSFESATYSVDEGDDVTIKVKLSADPERQVIISITASEQGSADTSDYSGVPIDVTFESGETEQTFTFTAEQDTVDDDNESVLLRFDTGGFPDRVSEGITNNEATVSIDDDDVPSVEVSFELASYSVNEGSTVEIKVKLSADPERQVIIPITTNDQDSAGSNDYSPMPNNVTFQSGEAEVILDFIATDDSLDDDGESVKLSFGSQLPDQVTAVTPDETTISINDDDGASVKVTPTSLTITEGGSQNYTVVLTSQPTADVTITVTPPSNPDVSVNKTTLTFTDSTWDDEQTVTVSVAQDTDALAETATITHSAASTDTDYDGISVGSVNVTVIDDETEVSFGAEMYMATEGGEDATVTVHLSQPATARLVIQLTAEGKTGATPDDWSGVPPTLTFNVGEDVKSFTVVATDDTIEDSGEKVEIGFDSPLPTGVVLGTPDTAMVTLANAECDNLATEMIILDELGEITQAGEKDFWTFDPDPYRHYIIEVIGVDGRDMLGRDTHPGNLTLEDPELISVRAVEGPEGSGYSPFISDAGYGQNSNGGWWWSGPGPFRIEVGGSGGTGTYQIKVRVNNICAMRDGERFYPWAGGPNGYDRDQAGDTSTRRILRTVPVWHNGYGPSGGFLGDNNGDGDERDEDWFKVELDQGYEYTVVVSERADVPAKHRATQVKIVGIYDNNGTLIAGTSSSSGNHVGVDFRPTSTGVYYVAVGYDGQDGLYDIDATGTAV